MSCGAFVCSGSACKTSCAAASDCAAGSNNDYCEGGQCYMRLPPFSTCSYSAQCQGDCCCACSNGNKVCNVASCDLCGGHCV
jgi:hypothetical protein